ncbi:hypothetical protein PLICRDRAFT_192151 [Plicaturopsis crispa FD-325 SS-3]|nr:hypothetical protein PLICRDRAFT_192151 [Plicaturopsis crispa FD-325 SS-3]
MAHQPSVSRVGTEGIPTTVFTNSFEITRPPNKRFFQYRDIAPDVSIPRKREDGEAMLFASHQLAIPGGSHTFEVGMSKNPKSSRGIFTVKLAYTNEAVQWTALRDLIVKSKVSPQAQVALNLLQNIINATPNLQRQLPHKAKAYFVDQGTTMLLREGLELWPGYFQSVRPVMNRVLVNIDVSAAAMYKRGPLVDTALGLLQKSNKRDLMFNSIHDTEFRKLRNLLKGVKVVVATDRRKPPGEKRIRDLVIQAGRYEFDKDERPITVQEYFARTYNITGWDPLVFGVKVGNDAVFPAQLCTVLPGQFFKKKLNAEVTKEMVKFSTRKPHERLELIQSGAGAPASGYANSRFLHDAEMTVSTVPVQIAGRTLQPPAIKFGDNQKGPHVENVANGTWNFRYARFTRPAAIETWAVVNLTRIPYAQIERFAQTLKASCESRGIVFRVGMPHMEAGMDPVQTLDLAVRQIFKVTQRPPTLVVVILPRDGANQRRAVKQWGDITHGIATQCIREPKVPQANDQYCGNVALKINARLGGQHCIVQSPILLELLNSGPYMIMGADVSHSAPGVRNQPSVASLVWSLDMYATRYTATSTVQAPKQEMIGDLQMMVERAVRSFSDANPTKPGNPPTLPMRIFFYRDGLSEGEYRVVAQDEIASVRAALASVWQRLKCPLPQPTLTFIVVGKRHHVRFFPLGKGDGTGNVHPGFVADQGLQSPHALDFYLQSHAGLKGTSRPAHYSVIVDDNYSYNMNKLQALSYALCHVYARATRTVSIPAPVYYADLVCARGQEFYFDDALRYDEDVGSTSGTGAGSFDIQRWTDGYKRVHVMHKTRMYFM